MAKKTRPSFPLGKLILPIVLAAAAYLALIVYGRSDELWQTLGSFRIAYLLPILGLALANYGLRFVRWQYYLERVGARVPLRESAGVFLSGFAMSVTPARVGELLKCVMLRDEADVKLAASVPAVVAERVTDLVAICLLIALGMVRYSVARGAFLIAAAVIVAIVVALGWSPWIAAGATRLFAKRFARGEAASATSVHDAATMFAVLLRGRSLLAGVALGTLAWFAECAALYLVLGGLGDWHLSLLAATFVYALSTLAGALSLLPGGLGATELGMTALLAMFGVARETAVAAVLLIRLCTLWFATALGVVAYLVHRRRIARLRGSAEPYRPATEVTNLES